MHINKLAIRRWLAISGIFLLSGSVFPNYFREPIAVAEAPFGESTAFHCMRASEVVQVERVAQQIQEDGTVTLLPIAPTLCRNERELAFFALSDAAKVWTDGMEGLSTLKYDESASRAEVKIEFVRNAMMAGEPVAGYIRWAGTEPGEKITIVVGTRDKVGRNFSRDAIMNTIAHELGHALGLDDAPNSGGVMAKVDPALPVLLPSSWEKQAAQAIRRGVALPMAVDEKKGR